MQKGFVSASVLILILLLIVVAGGAFYLTSSRQKASPSADNYATTTPSTPATSQKDIDPTLYKVGQKIGPLTVMSVQPADPSLGEISNENLEIKLKGQVTLTGMYEWTNLKDLAYGAEEKEQDGVYSFETYPASLESQLPGMVVDLDFTFYNRLDAHKLFDKISGGEATVVISDLTLEYAAHGRPHHATLVDVVSAK